MDLAAFSQNVLALPRPWRMSRVECFPAASRVAGWLEHGSSRFPRPLCMAEYAVHDHLRERVWQHLDTCGYQTFLHARLPRVEWPCSWGV